MIKFPKLKPLQAEIFKDRADNSFLRIIDERELKKEEPSLTPEADSLWSKKDKKDDRYATHSHIQRTTEPEKLMLQTMPTETTQILTSEALETYPS